MEYLRAKAVTYFEANEFKKATEYFESEAVNFTKINARDNYVTSKLLSIRFKILLGDYQISIDELNDLKKLFPNEFKTDSYSEGLFHFLAGSACYYLGDVDVTQEHAAKATIVFSPNKPSYNIYDYLNSLMLGIKTYWRQREFLKIFELFIKLFSQYVNSENKPTYLLAKACNLIGAIVMDLGMPSDAMKYLELSQILYSKPDNITLPANHLYRGILLSDIALCKLRNKNRISTDELYEAEEYNKAANQIFESLYEYRPHRYKATILKIEARILKEKAAPLEDILKKLDEEIEMRREAYKKDKHDTIARAYNYKARACISKARILIHEPENELKEQSAFSASLKLKYAIEKAQLAIEKSVEFLDPSNPYKNPSIEIFNQNIAISELLKGLHNKAEANILSYCLNQDEKHLEIAQDTISTSIQIIAQLNQQFNSEEAKLILLEQTRPTHELAMELLLLVYERQNEQKSLPNAKLTVETVFQIVLTNKSSLLLDFLINEKKTIPPLTSEEIINSYIENINQIINELYDHLEKYTNGEESEAAIILEGLTRLMTSSQAETYFNIKDVNQTSLVNESVDFSLAKIMNGISDLSGAIISYFIGEKAIYAIFVGRDKFSVKKLVNGKDEVATLREQVREFHDIINIKIEQYKNFKGSQLRLHKDPRPDFIELAYKLYCILIQPLRASELKDKERIYIIPDDVLWSIPFECLALSQADCDYHEIAYLHNDFFISYHFSIPLIYHLYNFMSRNKLDAWREKKFISILGHTTNDHTRQMAEERIRKWADKFRASKLFSLALADDVNIPSTTPVEFLKKTQNFDVILIHSHGGIYHRRHGLIPAIRIGEQNHIMSSAIHQAGKWDCQLLILHSCFSGAGPIRIGEGVMALNRAFMRQGVRNIIYTLFRIPTESSSEIIDDFIDILLDTEYEYLFPFSMARALNEAKKYASKKPGITPRDWAGLVFMGDQIETLFNTF